MENVFGHNDNHVSFTDFAKTTTEEEDFTPTTAKSVKDVCVIMFSSGTSGFPKGICHTHYSILSANLTVTKVGETASFTLCSDSPYWNVFLFFLNDSILNGSIRVVYPKFKLSETWKVFTRKITFAFLNVTELMTLCDTPKPAEIDVSALQFVVTGGSPINDVQIEKARKVFRNVLVRSVYGLSEVFLNVLSFDIRKPKHVEMLKKKKNSCGLPKTGISYKCNMENEYKIVNNVIYTPNYSHQPDARGIGWVYYDHLLKNKDRVAQIDGITGEEDTFGDLKERCVRAAIGMKKAGIQYGDVVSVCTSNHLNSCVPHISAMFIGAKIAALDPTLSLSHALQLFKIVMPKLIFVEEASLQLIESVIQEAEANTIVVVFGHSDNHVSFTDFARTTTEETNFTPTTAKSVKDVSVIMFSSGTSGLSKGICHTHYSLLRSTPSVMKLGQTASFISCSDSPYWNVFLFYLNHSIRNGTARVVYPKFKLNETWNIFTRKITLAFLNSTELMTLCNTPKPPGIDTSALQMVITAGSPISEVQIEKARKLFPNVMIRINYGLSEVFPNALCFDVGKPRHVELLKKKKNSCGLPKTGISYKVGYSLR
ncbi:hypothetical protein FQR65_LT04871 [Abscondita terminalis]|nr:hypothetical protein FQR65_LT04871 [Abscondita terminalis]